MKNTLGLILVLAFVLGLAYGGWQLERWFHYKFGYQSSVQAEIEKRVKPLEDRVKKLEEKNSR